MKPYAGPRVASWNVYLDGRCVTSGTRPGCFAQALEAYQAGRPTRLERWESCPHPWCVGGTLMITKRGRMYPECKPCPQCAAGLGTFAIDEDISALGAIADEIERQVFEMLRSTDRAPYG